MCLDVGTFTIPDTRLQSLIPDLKTMYNKLEQNDVDYTTLASVWGHKNARSGTFTAKKAMMITYGLIEGRGKVHITGTGRKIAQTPVNAKELNEGLIEAVTNIPLWKELYEKYTKVGKELPSSDFWLDLRQICRVSPEEAKNKAEIVRKAYLEDIKDIESPKGGDSDMGDDQNVETGDAGAQPRSGMSRELSFITDGESEGIELRLVGEDLKEKWKKFRAVIDAYVGVNEKN